VILVTAECVLALTLQTIRCGAQWAAHARGYTMDAIYFRDKAETCLRLAKGLSWNNPARGELLELAEEFQRQAEELEVTEQPPAR